MNVGRRLVAVVLLLYAFGAALFTLLESDLTNTYLQVGAVVVSFAIFLVQSATPSASGGRVPSRTAEQDRFANGERVVILMRRHIAAVAPSTVMAIATISLALFYTEPDIQFANVLWLIAIAFSFQAMGSVATWYATTTIITNLRVKQISGLFGKQTVTSFSLQLINGLELSRSAMGRGLGYGRIVVRSSTDPDFSLTYVPDPFEIYNTLWRLSFGTSEGVEWEAADMSAVE